MHKFMLLIATFAVAALFTGCATYTVTNKEKLNNVSLDNETTVAHINAENWGLYFFMIPVMTGSTENPGEIVFFQDTVRVENVVKMVTKLSNKEKATKTLDMVSKHNNFVWMFGFRDVQVSANAVR